MAKACKVTTITFKTKRGRKISFKGHSGANCPARKKPSTSHLKPWKTAMAAAAKRCKREKAGRGFRNCVAGALKSVRG